jgi:isoleucyl-tRNA synthetase
MVLHAVPAALGPRLGGRTQDVIKAIKNGDWTHDGDRVVAGGIELMDGEYTLKIAAVEGEASATMSDGRGVVTLDTEVTPELEAEGTARDLVRLVQQSRRDAGLAVSDRISLTLGVPEAIRRRLQPFVSFIAAETLAESVQWGHGEPTARLDDDEVYIGVERRS